MRESKFFIREHIKTSDRIALCAVPARTIVAIGKLDSVSAPNFHRRFEYALHAANVMTCIGGIDVSLNVNRDTGNTEWVPHLHVVTHTDDAKKLKSSLAKLFPKTDSVPRPIKGLTFSTPAIGDRTYTKRHSFAGFRIPS